MKYSVKHNLLFFLQYLIMIMLWYWLFRDSPAMRFVTGTVVIGYSLLILFRPQLFPNRPGITGRVFPERLFSKFRKSTCWTGVLIGVVILSGYRITTYRFMGIIALLFTSMYLVIYLYWIINSDKNERSANKGFWIFAISTLSIFSVLGVMFIIMGDKEIRFFPETSPYPMMIVYALMGAWHYRVIRKKERQLA